MSFAVGGVFVGRGRELSELETALGEVCSGSGGLFLLAGEPGIGKTRLSRELASRATARGMTTIWGRCQEGGGAPVYWPWVQVLRRCTRDLPASALQSDLGSGGLHVAQILPELREEIPGLAGSAPAPTAGSEDARFELFDATTTFLRNVARRGPLLLIFDDLHAADTPSLLLLRFLARQVADAHILIVGTYRDVEVRGVPETAELIHGLGREGHCLPLTGLAESEVARFVEDAAGRRLGDDVVNALWRSTEGNPFFLDEVVRLLIAERGLDNPEQLAAGTFRIPDRVRDTIRLRLRLLPDESRAILSVCAVIGREFDLGVLERVGTLGTDRLTAVLTEARDGGIVDRVAGLPDRHSFTHALFRETLYDDLDPSHRAVIHLDVAASIESLQRPGLELPLADLAHHNIRALPQGDPAKAVEYSARAAGRAAGQLAFEEAAAHCERALRVLDTTQGDESCRAELLLTLGDARWSTGAFGAARDAFVRAAAVAEANGNADVLARAALGHGGQFTAFDAGVVDPELVRLLERALTALGDEESLLHARVMARLAEALTFAPGETRHRELARAATKLARHLGDPATLAEVLDKAHWATWSPDNLEERLAVTEEVVRLAESVSDPRLATQLEGWRLAHRLENADSAGASKAFVAHAARAGKLRNAYQHWVAAMATAMRAHYEGRLAEVETLAAQALAIGQTGDNSNAAGLFGAQLLFLRREQGRLGEVVDAVRAYCAQYTGIPTWRCGLAWVLAEVGESAEAKRELDELARGDFSGIPRDMFWLAGMWMASEAAVSLGDAARAERLYAMLRPFADRCMVTNVAVFGGSMARTLGALATVLGRFPDAVRSFETALEVNRALGSDLWVAHTRYDYARMLLARDQPGDRAHARSLLDEVLAPAGPLGIESLAAKAAALRDGTGEAGRRETVAAVEIESEVWKRSALAGGGSGATILRFPTRTAVAAVPSRSGATTVPPPVLHPFLHEEGDTWSLTWRGESVRLRSSRGLALIAHLVAHPDCDFHAVDLATGGPLAGVSPFEVGRRPAGGDPGDAGEILDSRAKGAYRQRLEDLRNELAEAERNNDAGRAGNARDEIESLTQELSAAVGLGGRNRKAAAGTERARITVTKRIHRALERIAAVSPGLADHLKRSLKTGVYCSYRPDPRG